MSEQEDYGGYTAHPAADLFPLMEGEEFDELVADIKANGLLEPIDILAGTKQILDGRNRARACVRAGVMINVDPIVLDGEYEVSPYKYVISKNLHRRQLTEDQRAMIAAEAAEYLAAEKKAQADLARSRAAAERRDPETGRLQSSPKSGSTGQHRDTHAGQSATQAAQVFGTTRYKVEQAKRIKNASPQTASSVRSGESSAAQAEKRVAPRPERDPLDTHGGWIVHHASPEKFLGWLDEHHKDYFEGLLQVVKEERGNEGNNGK